MLLISLILQKKIDRFLERDKKLQQLLWWINEKAHVATTPYKSSAVRAFYFSLAKTLIPAFTVALKRDDLALSSGTDLTLASTLDCKFESHFFGSDLEKSFASLQSYHYDLALISANEKPSGIASLLALAERFAAELTEEELAQLPTDGAVEHDHYIYGIPKRYSHETAE